VLAVSSEAGSGAIQLSAGRVTGATAPGLPPLGVALIEAATLDPAALAAAGSTADADDGALVGRVWKDERIDRTQLARLVRQQIMAALERGREWPTGAFSFHGASAAEPAPLSFDLQEV